MRFGVVYVGVGLVGLVSVLRWFQRLMTNATTCAPLHRAFVGIALKALGKNTSLDKFCDSWSSAIFLDFSPFGSSGDFPLARSAEEARWNTIW